MTPDPLNILRFALYIFFVFPLHRLPCVHVFLLIYLLTYLLTYSMEQIPS